MLFRNRPTSFKISNLRSLSPPKPPGAPLLVRYYSGEETRNMSTQAQINANRRNAQKSTGPKSPEGRAAVRLNGVKHGLCAETLVLPGESEADFEALLDAFESEHQPETAIETAIVRHAAMCTWRLQRVYRA